MKIFLLCVFLLSASGCNPRHDSELPLAEGSDPAIETASFRMGNPEIREEMFAVLEKNGVEFWINDNGSIGYFLTDGELIDKLGTEIILAYVSRN